MAENVVKGGSAEVKNAALLTAENIKGELKPLSQNGFVAFFQKIGRGWLSFWYGLSERFPKLTKILYMLFFFILFSQAVTVFQFLIFNFGVIVFQGTDMAGNNWGLPLIEMGKHFVTGEPVYFRILGAAPRFDDAGQLITGAGAGGLAYFIMFMVGTFLAQVINFPLQRNITFRSHGNPWYQAMWYLIGWILLQPVTMAIGSAWEGLRDIYLGAWPGFVTTLLNTVIMGGVAMVIFFFVFLVIFPDYNKVEKSKKAKLEKLKAKGASAEAIVQAEVAVDDAAHKAMLSNSEKAAAKAATLANAKALAYFASVRNLESGKKGASKEKVSHAQQMASNAIAAKYEAKAEFEAVKAAS